MLCLKSLAKYFLAAAVLGSLSVGSLSAVGAFQGSHADADDDSSHRGSGRIVTQDHDAKKAIAYRGTGRVCNQEHEPLAHRGSGRIDSHPAEIDTTAYRGSGRIAPQSTDVMVSV